MENYIPPPYTVENWIEQYTALGNVSSPSMLRGYMDCIDRITPELDKIANTAKNFDELKAELLKFSQQQKDFVADVVTKWTNNRSDPPAGLPYVG